MRFANQHACPKDKVGPYYYATRGFYLPAAQVDEIAMSVAAEFLDSDMSTLPQNVVMALKRIVWDDLSYLQRRELVRIMIDRAIYSQEKLIFHINTNPQLFNAFLSEYHINQNANPTEDGKLRARITDYSKQLYELKVSCKYLRDIFEKDKDVKNLNNAIAASQYAHCRIGLARKFLMQENHCYLMLNGLFLY